MRAVIIGGTGHVGTYLVPRLVEAGYKTISISRGQQEPYQPHAAWKEVTQIEIDREEAEAEGTFGVQIRALDPDVVIDLICFEPESARMLIESLRSRVQHFLHCGTIWVHGHSTRVPTTESQPREPFGEYGVKKAEIEAYLLDKARRDSCPVTIVHPGHIVGPGWHPLNPVGNFKPAVFKRLARGEEVTLPNLGMETVHHVHADDVAQLFILALSHWSTSTGESFHAVSSQALTLRGYAESMAAWFGQEPNLRYLPWKKWKETVSEGEAEATWDHIAHSPNCSIEKARHLLGYKPRYTSLQAVQEAVSWMMENETWRED